MERKVLALFLIFLVGLVPILASILESEAEYQNIIDSSWKNWTVTRLKLAQDPDTGGWNGDLSATILPSLPETYHGVLALAQLNLSPANLPQTKNFLREYEREIYKKIYNNEGDLSFVDVYYLLVLFKELNMSVEDKKTIGNFLIDDVKRSNETYLDIKSLLLIDFSNRSYVKNASMSLWLSLKPESSVEFLWRFLLYRELLIMSGYSLDEVPNYNTLHKFAMEVFENSSRRTDTLGFFEIHTLARFMKEEGIQNESLRKELLRIISQYKCPDGSYSDTSGSKRGYIDTTHWAVEAIIYLGGKVGEYTIGYLRSLESPLGGFIEVPYTVIPNPLDTAFSVMTLGLLNYTVPRDEKVRDYLLSEISDENKPSVIWAEYRALRSLGVPNEDLKRIIEPRLQNFITGLNLSAVYRNHYLLKDVYYLLVTSNELGIEIDESWKENVTPFVLGLKDDDGGFGGRISSVKIVRLETTLYSVLILNELGYEYRDKKTAEFIESNRNGELWWSLPITRYALLALNSMGIEVKGKEEIVKALERRKCPYGFFSYAPCESPEQGDPIATFLALDILGLLGYR
ncbi:hypothetical protein A3L11_01780 [Thermococcus siculi]|uniref:Prenyltransferase alpha-alpha toroid domain-containing protein n=1 Tax=Thermococcus siculi TaxID=72803 RepID=A0A2Z2MV28_9EURY|nr:hypothetical protein [Thermococcus siculi]ASJ08023.1 hypothetical protein A3L11_01780 [Thermococcus siculi]